MRLRQQRLSGIHEELGIRFFPRHAVVNVVHDADDRPRLGSGQQSNLRPDRASQSKVAACQRARDEQHLRAAGAIRRIEPAPFQEPHAHGAQVAAADRSSLRRGWVAQHLLQRSSRGLENTVHECATGERREVCEAGGGHAGQCIQTRGQFVGEDFLSCDRVSDGKTS